MIGIIVAAHDRVAESLVNTACRIAHGRKCTSDREDIVYINVPAKHDQEALENEFKEKMALIAEKSDEILWLVDIFGGTPFTIAVQTSLGDDAGGKNQALVTGANLPIVLQALTERGLPLSELADHLEKEGRESIRMVKRRK